MGDLKFDSVEVPSSLIERFAACYFVECHCNRFSELSCTISESALPILSDRAFAWRPKTGAVCNAVQLIHDVVNNATSKNACE